MRKVARDFIKVIIFLQTLTGQQLVDHSCRLLHIFIHLQYQFVKQESFPLEIVIEVDGGPKPTEFDLIKLVNMHVL